jgi:hypothetical protein
LGYAALDGVEIDAGIQRLATVLDTHLPLCRQT